jgi:cation diffusion facilitator family transporter
VSPTDDVSSTEHDERGHHDHDHDHDHDHGHDHHDHAHRSGLRGALIDIFRPHSHDAADSVDTALEADARGMRALKISFVALMATSVVQVMIITVTGSVALLADTIHNFSDALTAVPLFIAFRLARRAPNRRYTYGYGRAEDLAGLFVLAMIALSAVIAAWEAIGRLIHPRDLDNLGWLLAAGIVGFAGNELVALYRIRVGTRIGSAALVADGYHARTDGFTSLAVALGAIGVWLGFDRADPLVGLLISVAIFAVLRGATRQVLHRVMDAVDPEIVDRIEQQTGGVAGVLHVDRVQARWIGHQLSANVAVQVGPARSATDAYQISEAVREKLLRTIPRLETVDVMVGPAPLTRPPHDSLIS